MVRLWFLNLPIRGGSAVRITDVEMVLTVDEKSVATARFTKHAAADGHAAWIVSAYEACLFICNQAAEFLPRARPVPDSGRADGVPDLKGRLSPSPRWSGAARAPDLVA